MRPSPWLLALPLLAAFGCEPADTGGGAGIGGKIAYLRTGGLATAQDSGDGEKLLTDANTSAEPALSPNGQTVAFAFSAAHDENARELDLVPVGGGQRTSLATPPAGTTYGSPTWSRDSTVIVFVATSGADSELLKVAAGGGAPEPVAGGHKDLHFPAFIDANTLLVSQGAGLALQSLDLTTGLLKSLDASSPSRAAVSPDGKKIAYAKEGATTRIYVRDLAGGIEVALATTTFGDTKPAFAPDGTFVAFDAKGPNESGPKIYAAKVTLTGDPGGTVLLQSGSDVSWSP